MHTYVHSYIHTSTVSLHISHSITLSLYYTLTHSLTHSHTHTLTHSHTHTLTLDRYRTALSERHLNITWPHFMRAVLHKDGYDNIHWTPQSHFCALRHFHTYVNFVGNFEQLRAHGEMLITRAGVVNASECVSEGVRMGVSVGCVCVYVCVYVCVCVWCQAITKPPTCCSRSTTAAGWRPTYTSWASRQWCGSAECAWRACPASSTRSITDLGITSSRLIVLILFVGVCECVCGVWVCECVGVGVVCVSGVSVCVCVCVCVTWALRAATLSS